MTMTDTITNVVLAKVCSIKPDGDSTDKKAITLRVKFDGVTLADVFSKAVSGAVIQWQNGPGRKHFDKWTNNQTIDIDFKAPGKAPTIDPEVAVRARLAAMSPEMREAYIADLLEDLPED